MSCTNFSSDDWNVVKWNLPPCSRYFCPLLPVAVLIPVTVISVILLVFGVAGNVLTVLLTARVRELRNTINLYLGSLAVADLLLLLLGLPIDLYRLWRSRPWVLGVVMCRVWHWSGEACAYCSILHLTALTVERYLAICSPLRAKVLITRCRVKVLLAVIWTVALLSASPFFFLVSVQQAANSSSDDDFSRECAPTRQAMQSGMLSSMLWITTSYFLLPVFCLYILYGLIVRELLRGSAANLRKVSHRGHRQTVRMLVLLVLAFVICWLPFHVGRIIYINVKDSWMMHVSQYLNVFAMQFFYLNACINPILYNLRSKKYRAAAVALLMNRSGKQPARMSRTATSYRETSRDVLKSLSPSLESSLKSRPSRLESSLKSLAKFSSPSPSSLKSQVSMPNLKKKRRWWWSVCGS